MAKTANEAKIKLVNKKSGNDFEAQNKVLRELLVRVKNRNVLRSEDLYEIDELLKGGK